ncbi:hypothetical protein BASA61_001655 [Batrachochytrium salamandrivorans]|nr:hypothetical protein BASA61_001655 [Batrachochytrium salamandrivorans]
MDSQSGQIHALPLQQRRRSVHSDRPGPDTVANQRNDMGNTPLMVAVVALANAAASHLPTIITTTIGTTTNTTTTTGTTTTTPTTGYSGLASSSYSDSTNSRISGSVSSKRTDILALIHSPKLNINLQDLESGYTVLHKCIYHGCLEMAVKILQFRPDADLTIKDKEGYTCLDLLNMTTKPPKHSIDKSQRLIRSGDRSHIDRAPMRSPIQMPIASRILEESTAIDLSSEPMFSDDDDDDNENSCNLDDGRMRHLPTPKTMSLNPSKSVWSWGSNKNFVLGHFNPHDRTNPECIDLMSPLSNSKSSASVSYDTLADYDPQIEQMVMSKYHACIRTDSRLYTYGFGSGGRLGLGHEETTMQPVEVTELAGIVKYVAVGPDHTIAITLDGSVWTWGSNEYLQLGYPSESAVPGSPRQLSPQIVPIKKVVCAGAAGSKFHTVVFTTLGVLYTWGTNNGQLGYQQAVQSVPRKVTSFPVQGILAVAATNCSTAVLTATNEVFVFAEDKHTKVVFPQLRTSNVLSGQYFTQSSAFSPTSRSPRLGSTATKSKPHRAHNVIKIVAGNHQYAALMSTGDVYMWSPPEARFQSSWQQTNFPQRRPKLVWSVRRKYLAARDVDIGVDSNIVIGTRSGHVFVGTRRTQTQQSFHLPGERAVYVSPRVLAANSSNVAPFHTYSTSSETGSPSTLAQASFPPPIPPPLRDTNGLFKYAKISNLQNIVMVVASVAGAFSAVRSDIRPHLPPTVSTMFASDFYRALHPKIDHLLEFQQRLGIRLNHSSSLSKADASVGTPSDISSPTSPPISSSASSSYHSPSLSPAPILGSYYDIEFSFEGGIRISAHCVILANRSPVFRAELCTKRENMGISTNAPSNSRKPNFSTSRSAKALKCTFMHPTECSGMVRVDLPQIYPESGMLFLNYIYTGRLDLPRSLNRVGSSADDIEELASSDKTKTQCSQSPQSKTHENTESKLHTRVHQEFTRLSKYFRLDETEILYASMDAASVAPSSPLLQSSPVESLSNQCDIITSIRYRQSMAALYTTLGSSFTDVVIHLAGDEKIEAHSVILSARSVFFNAAIGSHSPWNCYEKGEDAIETPLRKKHLFLTHISVQVFKVVMEWIYTDADPATLFDSITHNTPAAFIGFVVDVMGVADELLLAESTYLRDCCGDVLCQLLNIRNAIDVLVIADCYSSTRLKRFCLDFICWNLETFLESPRWFKDLGESLLMDLESHLKLLQIQQSPIMRGPDGFYANLRQRTLKADEVLKAKRRQAYETRKRFQEEHEIMQRESLESGNSAPNGIDSLSLLSTVSTASFDEQASRYSDSELLPMSNSVGSRGGIAARKSGGPDLTGFKSVVSTPGCTPQHTPIVRHVSASPHKLSVSFTSVDDNDGRYISISPIANAECVGRDGPVSASPDNYDDSTMHIFKLEMETDVSLASPSMKQARPSASATAFATSSQNTLNNTRSSPAIQVTPVSGSGRRHGQPAYTKLDFMDSAQVQPVDTLGTSSSAPSAISPVLKGWSPVICPVDPSRRVSLRDIMNETRDNNRVSSASGHPHTPNTSKASPSIPNLSKYNSSSPPVSSPRVFSPRAAAVAATSSVLQSPFTLGEPLVPFTIKITTQKKNQKQRKMKAAMGVENIESTGSFPPAAPAWGGVFPHTAIDQTLGGNSFNGGVHGVKSLRDIQIQQESLKSKETVYAANSKTKSASTDDVAFLRSPSVSKPNVTLRWSDSGWASPGTAPQIHATKNSMPDVLKSSSKLEGARLTKECADSATQMSLSFPKPKRSASLRSFLQIQVEQEAESLKLARALRKPLERIQMEEKAIRALTEFYLMTQASGTGEWIVINRQS